VKASAARRCDWGSRASQALVAAAASVAAKGQAAATGSRALRAANSRPPMTWNG
jgi:hypothetical protein